MGMRGRRVGGASALVEQFQASRGIAVDADHDCSRLIVEADALQEQDQPLEVIVTVIRGGSRCSISDCWKDKSIQFD